MKKKIAIIGGGISGLATAYYFLEKLKESEQEYEIHLFEKDSKLGGIIQTSFRDGFLLEEGPDSFITDKPEALELAKEIGLEDELTGLQLENRGSFILYKNQLVATPKGFYLMGPSQFAPILKSPLLSPLGKLRMMLELFVSPKRDKKEESLKSFVTRRFGKEVFERIAQPMVGGIYTADPELLSLNATMPKFQEMEKKFGSVSVGLIRAQKIAAASHSEGPRYQLFMSFKKGLIRFIDVLEEKLKQVTFHLSSQVTSIEKNNSGWLLHFEDRNPFEADMVCLTTPAHIAAKMTQAHLPELSQEMTGIPYESVVIFNIAFKKTQFQNFPRGFGFVVPQKEGKQILAASFIHLKYDGRAPEDSSLLRVFVGGYDNPDFIHKTEEEMTEIVLSELNEIMPFEGKPLFVKITPYRKAMPQYHLGHQEKVNKIKSLSSVLPGLFITGNAYEGVGIPDSIRKAKETAEEMTHYFQSLTEKALT